MVRIAIAGFQHETNTFAPLRTELRHFEEADAWPALCRGAELFDSMAGVAMPISGFIEVARRRHELVPIVWCFAEAGSFVTRDAFETIAGMICDDLRTQGPFDAVYLDLHGAMVAEHVEDGEGELLERVRAVVGRAIPVVASLDLHANVSARMVRETESLTIFRTYPHVDMADAGARSAELLLRRLAGEPPPAKAFRQGSFLVPLHEQCTLIEPNRGLYAELGAVGRDVVSIDLAMGFPPADVADCGPAIVAYAARQAAADAAADRMAATLAAAEKSYGAEVLDPDAAVRRAMADGSGKPVLLADTQDNTGAGGTGDTTGLLEALLRQQARGAVVAVIADGEAARQAHAAGLGSSIGIALGNKSGVPGHAPWCGRVRVSALGDGNFARTGPVNHGARCALGPMASLRVEAGDADVRVIVASQRFQAHDQSAFRHLGVEPSQQRILAIKSSVHFHADFDPIVAASLIVAAPGANPADPRRCIYRRLRDGVRLAPNGPRFLPVGAG